MAFTRPLVLTHGYSDKVESFESWRQALVARLYIRLNASTGRTLLQFQLYDSAGKPIPVDRKNSDVLLNITRLAPGETRLLYPGTTPLIEFRPNRETVPVDVVSQPLYFLEGAGNPPTPTSGN